MSKQPTVRGRVIENLPSTNFKVQMEDGSIVLAYLCGKMRVNYIKVLPGDHVEVVLSPDGARGRITRRL